MRSENVRRAGWSTCLDTGTVSGTSASPACRGTYCSGPQAAWPCDAGSPTATRHTCTSRRKDPVQVVLPGSQVASRGNLWTRKHNLHTRQSISLTYISCRCTCSCSIYTVCFVIVWRRRRAADTSTNRRHGFICRRTASMEQAADTAEAAAVDRYFSSPAKHFYSSLQLRIRTQGTNWWLPCWCAVGLPVAYMGWVGRNINNSHCLLMTYTFLYFEQRCRNFNTCKLNS